MPEEPDVLQASSLVQLENEFSEQSMLQQMVLDYYRSGADCEDTLKDNRTVFSRFKLLPRMLRDVSHIDMTCNILGTLLAPGDAPEHALLSPAEPAVINT